MRTFTAACLFCLLGSLMTACASEDPTLRAEHAALGTQAAVVRATATLIADRLSQTQEAAGTRIARLENRRAEVVVTLQEAGLNPTALAAISPDARFLATTTATPPPNAPPVVFNVQGTPNPGGPAVALVTAAPAPALSGVTMANAVGDDDCALEPANTFVSSAERIYIVATAAQVPPGTVLGSQWRLGDQLLVTHEFTLENAIETACIWFFADQTDFQFLPGEYGVQLTINGGVVGPLIPFTIVVG